MKSKEEYIEKLAEELKEWSAQIDGLHAKAEAAAEDAKLKYQEEIAELRVKEQAAREKVKELQDAGAEAWESVKDTVENVWHELSSGLSNVVGKFKD